MSDTNKAGLIPIRAVRVPDQRWTAAMSAAKKNSEPLSVAINRFLDEYAAGKHAPGSFPKTQGPESNL